MILQRIGALRILAITVITILTLLIWGKVLNQALIAEGSIYFAEPYLSFIDKEGLGILWSRHDVQSILFFQLVRDIFKDNMQLYMGFLLIGSAFVSISIFFLTQKIITNFWAAILSSILFIANFVGSFEILGLGYYQWFIQRVPNFGLALISLLFLHKFLQTKKIRDYSISLVLYLLAVFLARYTIHILPLFIFYLFLVDIFNKNGNLSRFTIEQITRLLKKLPLALPYLLGTYILIKAQTLTIGDSDPHFFQNTLEILKQVFSQLTYLTIPLLTPIFSFSQSQVRQLIEQFYPATILLYLLTTIFIVHRLKTVRPFILALVLSLPLSIYLSIYLNPGFLQYYDSSRYLYYTSILFSIFWGIVLWQIAKINKICLLLVCIFIIFWTSYNAYLIHRSFSEWQERHDPVIATVAFMQKHYHSIVENSAVLMPKEVGNYGTWMFRYYYPQKNTAYFVTEEDVQNATAKPGNPYQNIIQMIYNPATKQIELSTTKKDN